MAEAIISEIVTKHVEELASMGFKKINFAVSKDLDSTIEQLGDFLRFINATLQNVDPFEASNDIERMKIERLQFIHDEMNCFFTKLLAARTGVQREMGSRGFTAKVCSFVSSPKQYVLRFKYAAKVNDLTSKITSLASTSELCKRIAIDPFRNHNLQTPASEDTSHFPDTDVFIGRDTDKKNIINLLCKYSVVAIVGVGGQGKTTLAQYVCQDDWVKRSFHKLLWAFVTPKSSVNEILEKIITSATGEKPIACGSEQLHLQVWRAIFRKKCLLVLDNVCYGENLRDDSEALNTVLKKGGFWGNGGKILITTRQKKVAQLMNTPEPYELSDLAEDDCWNLLQHYAITREQEEKKESGLEEIGKEIVKMCPKVPLVLKAMGCQLARMDNKGQWEAFKKELDSYPTLYMSKQEKIKQILKHCYDQLDYNLKRCVVYCWLFPKGHKYDKNYMVRIWIALGFIESKREMSLEDVGDAYVFELTDRAFFEEAHDYGVFQMHDVMHDLMHFIGKDKHQKIDSKTEIIDDGVRHVSFTAQDLNWEVLLSSSSGKKLESILSVSRDLDKRVYGVPLKSRIDELISTCQKLKVLEINKQEIEKVPKSIGKLTHMGHLDLSGNLFCKLPNEITNLVNLLSLNLSRCVNLQELPSKMGKLVNLLSLNLRGCLKLEELPREIVKLVKLRHLEVCGCDLLKCMPKGFENLRELETLDEFVVGESSRSSRGSEGKGGAKLEELGHLKKLKGGLCIKVAGESKYILSEAGNAYVEIKAKLRRLEIRFEKKGEEDKRFLEGIQLSGENWKELSVRNYGGKRLPLWMTDDRLFHECFPKLDFFYLFRTNVTPVRSTSDYDKDEFMRFIVKGKEDDLGEWVPRYSRIKEHLKMGTIEVHFTTRRRDGITLTDVREDATLEDVDFFIQDELAPRSGCDCGGQRQPDMLLKSCFPNLIRLYLWDIPELEVLPEEFRDLSSLEILRIWDCPKLKAIPDWIDTLSSLIDLSITGCPEVKVLPDSIGSLTSLTRLWLFRCTGLELPPHQISESCELVIYGCSKALFKKCVKPMGEYWSHLQHLQSLYINSSEGDEFEYRREESSKGDEISNDTSTALTIPQYSNDVAATPLTLIGLPTHPKLLFLRSALFSFFGVVLVVLVVTVYNSITSSV